MQKKILIYFYSINMSEKTLKFDNIEVNKKEFHAFKQAIDLNLADINRIVKSADLNLVDINKIVISDKFKHRDKGFKYFIGYKDDCYVRPLCIILPQMSGYIKYFENGGKYVFYD